jgi:hypothetical protein
MTDTSLSISKVLLGRDHISIKSHSEVVVNVFGWVVPFGLRSSCSDLELGSNNTFGSFEGCKVIVDVVIGTEVWNEVVDIISKPLLLVLVLSATS